MVGVAFHEWVMVVNALLWSEQGAWAVDEIWLTQAWLVVDLLEWMVKSSTIARVRHTSRYHATYFFRDDIAQLGMSQETSGYELEFTFFLLATKERFDNETWLETSEHGAKETIRTPPKYCAWKKMTWYLEPRGKSRKNLTQGTRPSFFLTESIWPGRTHWREPSRGRYSISNLSWLVRRTKKVDYPTFRLVNQEKPSWIGSVV